MGAVANCTMANCGSCGDISIPVDGRLAQLAGGQSYGDLGLHGTGADANLALVPGRIGPGAKIREFNSQAARGMGSNSMVPTDQRWIQDKLFQAAREGSFKKCVEAIGQGADVHAKTLRGQNALMLAASSNTKGTLDTMRFLMDTLSDLEAKDDSGWTPLLHACRNNQSEASQLLLDRGSSIKARASDGKTAVMLAAMDGGEALVMDLVSKSAPLDKKDDRGWSVLFVACEDGRHELVKWLLKKQANAKEKSKEGLTTLMVAAESGNKRIGSQLLKKSANLNSRNSDGSTALILSIKSQKEDYASWLLDEDADVSLKNNAEEDALEVSEQMGMSQLKSKIEMKLRAMGDTMDGTEA